MKFRRRQPLSTNRKSRRSRVRVIPAPAGGLNARDSLDNMPQSDAVALENWWPTQSGVVTRPGTDEFCDTGGGANSIAVMIPYEHTGLSKLLAACNGVIYEVSTGTAVSLATGLTGNNWVSSFLSGLIIMANGADVVKSYNGSTIASPAFTGVTLTNLNFVTTYKSRLYFVEKQTKKMWYGGTGSVAGALTSFDFSTVIAAKGDLMLVGHLSGDGGDGGQDDVFVAIFAGGTVAAYTGSDPGDATNWALLGVFEIGRPLSRLGVVQSEDDFYLVTTRGYEKLSQVMRFGRSLGNARLVSDKIQSMVNTDVEFLGASDNWRLHIWPTSQMLIATVPYTGSAKVLHAQNLNTKAWAKFSSVPAVSWAQLGKNCYFGANDGKVYSFSFSHTSDDGTRIRSTAQPAWSALGYKGYHKSLKFIRPLLRSAVIPSMAVSAGADFEDVFYGTFDAADADSGSSEWGEAVWGTAVWGGGDRVANRVFQGLVEGQEIGIRFTVDVTSSPVRWHSTGVIFELGGLL